MSLSINEVKEKCTQNKYFSYDSWEDRLFILPAMYLVWVCIRLGISGNAVSWLSAFVAIFGAFLLTSDDSLVVFMGSFGYIGWYLLDYVDGAVARFNGKGSVSGQYVDWIMHVIAHVATVVGIMIGAMSTTGAWIYPFVILGIIASSLAYAKFSMAWFAICMEQQQRRAKGYDILEEVKLPASLAVDWFGFKYIRGFTILVFHETHLVFWLPLIALFQLFQVIELIDLRIVFTVLAGTVYFLVQVLETHRLVVTKKIEKGYSELFSSTHRPDLPDDHFFK